MPRMQILSASEQAAFEQPPVFNFCERKRCFDLPKTLMDIATKLRSPSSQIGFLLMCAYFKAAKRFYNPRDFHASDIEAGAKLLGLSGSEFAPATYPKQTRARHRKLVLDFYGFHAIRAESQERPDCRDRDDDADISEAAPDL